MSVPYVRRNLPSRYRLIASYCEACNGKYFPKRKICPKCGNEDHLKEVSLIENGYNATVFSASVIRHPATTHTHFAPYISAVVELDGWKVPTMIADYDITSEEVDIVNDVIGISVEPVFRRITEQGEDGVIEYGMKFRPSLSSLAKEYRPYTPRKISRKSGLVGYGVYLPRYKVTVEEIARTFGTDAETFKRGLALEEKGVGNLDEDTGTYSVEAARRAINHAGIDPQKINAIWVGSESPPYAVKPTVTIVAEAIGSVPNCRGSDREFACKAATDAIPDAIALVNDELTGKTHEYTMVIGADKAQARPGDPLDYSVGEGGVAFIYGKTDVIAEPFGFAAYLTDTPDFWRREFEKFPSHGGRFTGDPAYFKHVMGAAKKLMSDLEMTPKDFDYAVFHQPNGKFPIRAGTKLGFEIEQLKPGLMVTKCGNLYSGSSPLGFAATLDIAQDNEKILLVAYGSGAGSDASAWITTDTLLEKRERTIPVKDQIKGRIEMSYLQYARSKGTLMF
jgi:hydroxymethylglutaryl-CoA synthase